MSIKLPEIQATLNELKNDSQAMQNAEVRRTVEHIEEMLSELELKASLVGTGDDSAAQHSTNILDRLTSIASRVLRECPQKEPILWILHQLAIAYRDIGEGEYARSLLEWVLESITGNDVANELQAETYRQLGILHFYRAYWNQAQAYYQKSLALFQAADDRSRVATLYSHLGDIAIQQGNFELAKRYHQQAITVGEQDENETSKCLLAGAYSSLGVIASIQADWDTALENFEKSITLYEAIGLTREAAGVYTDVAIAYVDAGELEAAGECYAEATRLAEESGNLLLLSKIYVNRAEFLLEISTIEAAMLYCNKAEVVFQKISDAIGLAKTYKLYGQIHRYQKAWDAATQAFTESIQRYHDCQNPHGEAAGCYQFGMMYKDCDNTAQAQYFLNRARLLYESLGAVESVERVKTELAAFSD